MEIQDYVAGSCAIMGIKDLALNHTNANAAMVTFCCLQLGTINKFRPNLEVGKMGKLANFYVFSCGPEVPHDHPNGSHHSKAHWLKYGTEFAQFILDNKLGELVTLGPKFNMKQHPRTTAQIWVWSPDQTALEQWWVANIPEHYKQRV